MVEFYLWVYREFPELAVEAARRLHSGIKEPSAQTFSGDYFGLPTRAGYLQFRNAGGRILRLGDLRRCGLTFNSGYATSTNFAPRAPQIGHFSGGTPNSMCPQTGHK